MRTDQNALGEPLFWAGFLCTSFGQIGDEFDAQVACDAFAVSEERAQAWWHQFTGWYEGVFDESDGWLENPSGVSMPLAEGLVLEVEMHPGGTEHYMASEHFGRHLLGDCGAHWRLPMLRWSEAAALAAEALVLVLPGVWVAPDQAQCRDHVEDHDLHMMMGVRDDKRITTFILTSASRRLARVRARDTL